jgi:hypothetical protein
VFPDQFKAMIRTLMSDRLKAIPETDKVDIKHEFVNLFIENKELLLKGGYLSRK